MRDSREDLFRVMLAIVQGWQANPANWESKAHVENVAWDMAEKIMANAPEWFHEQPESSRHQHMIEAHRRNGR